MRRREAASGRVPSFLRFSNSMANKGSHPHVLRCGGEAPSFAIDKAKAFFRNRISPIEPGGCAAKLLLRMTDISRKVCMAVGKDHIASADGAQHFLRILRERCAPDAI